ncbi:MAG: Ig-like domain-containing protein [Aeromicrobium sp.]
MSLITTRRTVGAGVATGALVTSTLLFAPFAQAANADVRESQIAAAGGSTAGWYQEAAGATNQITTDGLQLSGVSGVLNGNVAASADLDDLTDATATTTGSATVVVLVTDADVAGVVRLTPAAGGTWQSDKTVGTVSPNTPTSVADLKTAFGTNYKVTAFGVGNTSGASAVKTFVFDGTTYEFKNNAPTVANGSVKTKVNTAVDVPLSANDIDGNALTYKVDSVTGGSVTGTGATQRFTPAKNFKGNAQVAFTVTDGRGGSASAVTAIKVEKQKGKVDIYRVHPTRPSTRSTVYVYASVSVDGVKAAKGTTVYGYAKSKKVVTGKVNGRGKVKLKLPNKLPKGKSTLKVTQAGSSIRSGGTDSVVVRVRK